MSSNRESRGTGANVNAASNGGTSQEVNAFKNDLMQLWESLQGTWQLERNLHSVTSEYPSGTCKGTASFVAREPSVFIDEDGKLEAANREMVYQEQGEFEVTPSDNFPGNTRFNFSRKYVWRLKQEENQRPVLSVWFVKPGTDKLDYLFHKVDIQTHLNDPATAVAATPVDSSLVCHGGHLCIDDYYNSSYTFNTIKDEDAKSPKIHVHSWTMLHEVQGPKKDQVIRTEFSRS